MRSTTRDEELTAALVARGIPEHMHDGVRRYVLDQQPVGHFLTALFSDELQALLLADEKNQACMKEWIYLLVWDVPSACWGSRAKVDDWLASKDQGEDVLQHD